MSEGESLAIIGMACRLPKAATLAEYWQLLIEGRSAIEDAPADRLDRNLYYDPVPGKLGKTYTTKAALLAFPGFDARKCPLPLSFFASADVVQTSVCEVAAAACRDAGMNPFDLPIRNAGVYIGHTLGGQMAGDLSYAACIEETAQYLREVPDFAALAPAEQDAVIAEIIAAIRGRLPLQDPRVRPDGRQRETASEMRRRFSHCCHEGFPFAARFASAIIAEVLQLTGPAVTLDAACSSSLQALAVASRALRRGTIDMALVGGASYVAGSALILFSQARSVSARGSRPFDTAADGLVAGEGQIVMVVKTLDRALADGDRIHAVVRSIGVASDGRGKSLWAPRVEGQVEAMRRAYSAGLDMRRLQFIEAHATSTQAGDVTEMTALAEALRDQLPQGTKIPIGSVKANIGHTLETAGMASLLKVVLAMQHEVIPRQINVENLNKGVDWDSAPFFVPRDNIPWAAPLDGHPRRAAVNAFGIGGLNIHVVVDQFTEAACRRGFFPQNPSAESVKRTESAAEATRADASTKPAVASSATVTAADSDAVAVIGVGCILPGAQSPEAFWQLLESGRDPKCRVPADRWRSDLARGDNPAEARQLSSDRGGFVTDFVYDWKRHKVPPKQIANADPLQFMILESTDAAIRDAGYDHRPYDRKRVGAVVGTIFRCDFGAQLQAGLRLPEFRRELANALRRRSLSAAQIEAIGDRYDDIFLKRMPALLDETGGFTPSTLASRITKTFDLMGGAVALDAGSGSSLAALAVSIDQLLTGQCDMMICAAGQRSMELSLYEQLSIAGLLVKDEPRAGFDGAANGFVPGEGVGVVLLKRLADARRDGDRIRAIIRGVGGGFSRWPGEALFLASQRAMGAAQVAKRDIALVEGAGAGVPEVDAEELEAVLAAYADPDRRRPLLLGSATSQIGRLFGASGMVSLLKAIMELDHRKLPRTFAIEQPAAMVMEHDGDVQVPLAATKLATEHRDGRMFCGVSCFDLQGGNAYHAVVERGEPVPLAERAAVSGARPNTASTSAPRWKIVRFGGQTVEQVRKKMIAVLENGTAADLFHGRAVPFVPTDRYRVAIVLQDAAELLEKCRLAVTIREHSQRVLLENKGIYGNELPAQQPRIAMMFPGQGAQYAGMLRKLTESDASAAAVLRAVDGVLKRLNYPDFAAMAWEGGDTLGVDVFHTQLSLLAASTIVFQTLTSAGIAPYCVAGHSYGEFSALLAAGAWDFESAARATDFRARAIVGCTEAKGSMLATAAGPDTVDRLCREIGGQVFAANYNAPDQTVASGDAAAIGRLAELLNAEGFAARILAVPRPFHSPLMEGTRAPLRQALADIPIAPPQIPLLSSVNNRYVSEPDEIRDQLAAQMTASVKYVDLVRRLADEGTDVFLDVGPGSVLAGLHRKILAGRQVQILAANAPKRDDREQFLRAIACLDTLGAVGAAAPPWTADIFSLRPAPARPPEAVPAKRQKTLGNAVPSAISTKRLPVPAAAPAAHAETAVLPPVRSPAQTGSSRVDGSYHEMGLRRGRGQARDIQSLLERYAHIAGTPWDTLPAVSCDEKMISALFDPEELEEFGGLAEGAEVGRGAVLAHNLRLYTEQRATALHVAIRARGNAGGGMLHAANQDVALATAFRGLLRPETQVCQLRGRIPYITFGIAGQVGACAGLNAKGVAVTSAPLLDRPAHSMMVPGRLHPVIVRRILEQAADLDEAVAIVRNSPRHGAWGMCLSHAPSDLVCYLEYNGERVCLAEEQDLVIGCNHSLLLGAGGEVPEHSLQRLTRLRSLVQRRPGESIDAARLQGALRDRFDSARGRETLHPTKSTVLRSDNMFSLVMHRSSGDLWIAHGDFDAQGPKGDGRAAIYRRVSCDLPGNVDPRGNGAPPSTAAEPSVDFRAAKEGDFRGAKGDHTTVIDSPVLSTAAVSQEVGPAQAKAEGTCRRYVLRLVKCELAETAPAPAGRSAVVFGDSAVAHAIVDRLTRGGHRAALLSPQPDVAAVLVEFDRIWAAGPLPHLFIVSADAADRLDDASWQKRRQQGVMFPFLLCQKWFQSVVAANQLAEASLLGVVSLGGDFGLSGQVPAIEGGAVAGLIKGLRLETAVAQQTPIQVKIIDRAAATDPAAVAEIVAREWLGDYRDWEITYREGARYVLRPFQQNHAAEETPLLPNARVWVVTGGARGITAAVAKQLGARCAAKLHLIGSSPLPAIDPAWRNLSPEGIKKLRADVCKEAVAQGEVPIQRWQRTEKAMEIDRNLRAFAAAGIDVTYHSCDVSDRKALANVLDQVRAASGPIEGVLHGAGFESACSFTKKQAEKVSRTVAAKLDGAAALMELTANDPLRYFFGFGSTSGRLGGVGQTDYCLANEMLAKLVDRYAAARPEVKAATFHWHAWDEIGMAARPETRSSPILRHLKFMPPAEGVRHLMAEINGGVPEREIMITDPDMLRSFYPDVGVLPPMATSVAFRSAKDYGFRGAKGDHATVIDSPVRTPDPHEYPMLDRMLVHEGPARIAVESRLDPLNDPFLTQHMLRGKPLMPIVMVAETFAQVAALLAGQEQHVRSVRDLCVVDALRFFSDAPLAVRLTAQAAAEAIECRMTNDFVNRRGVLVQKDRMHATAVVNVAIEPPSLDVHMPEAPSVWHGVDYPDSIVIYHGPVFRCLQQMSITDEAGWGRIVAPDPQEIFGSRPGRRLFVPCAVLDACLFACGIYLWARDSGGVALPEGIGNLCLGRSARAGEECLVHLRCTARKNHRNWFSFDVFGSDRSVILSVEDYLAVSMPAVGGS